MAKKDYAALAAKHGGVADTTQAGAGPTPASEGGPDYFGLLGALGLSAAAAPDVIAALGQGANAGAQGAAGRLAGPLARFAAKRIPFVHEANDLAQMGREMMGPPPVAAAAEATAVPSSRTLVTQELIDKLPALKAFDPGDTIGNAHLDRIKVDAGKVSRPPLKLTLPSSPPKAIPNATEGATTSSRHEVQYYSEGKGKFIPIEDMPISHLRNAMNKLGAKLAASKGRPSPVTQKQFDAIKNEVTYRAQQAGELTVPSEISAIARNFRPSLGGAVGGLNEVAMILSMLNAPQQMAESEALFRQIKMDEDRKRMNPSTFRALYGQPQGN